MNGREKVDKTTFPTISPNVLGKSDTAINWTISKITVTVEIKCLSEGQVGTKPSISGDNWFSTTSAVPVTLSGGGTTVGSLTITLDSNSKYKFVGYVIDGKTYSAGTERTVKNTGGTAGVCGFSPARTESVGVSADGSFPMCPPAASSGAREGSGGGAAEAGRRGRGGRDRGETFPRKSGKKPGAHRRGAFGIPEKAYGFSGTDFGQGQL